MQEFNHDIEMDFAQQLWLCRHRVTGKVEKSFRSLLDAQHWCEAQARRKKDG